MDEKNYFSVLNAVNVNGKTEKKNGLTYLSWAWAWGEVKKLFPDAQYTVYQNEALGGMPYFTDGKTCMVKTGVTINGIEHIEFLPVMDFRNQSIPADKVTSFEVNKTIQRSLTKAVARHGLGLYIYAGEDLPEEEAEQKSEPPKKVEPPKEISFCCENCGKTLVPYIGANGKEVSVRQHATGSKAKFNAILCLDCIKNLKNEN